MAGRKESARVSVLLSLSPCLSRWDGQSKEGAHAARVVAAACAQAGTTTLTLYTHTTFIPTLLHPPCRIEYTHAHIHTHVPGLYPLCFKYFFEGVPGYHSLSHVAGICAVTLKAAELSAAAWRGDFH